MQAIVENRANRHFTFVLSFFLSFLLSFFSRTTKWQIGDNDAALVKGGPRIRGGPIIPLLNIPRVPPFSMSSIDGFYTRTKSRSAPREAST